VSATATRGRAAAAIPGKPELKKSRWWRWRRTRKPVFHLVAATLDQNDAVSNDVFGMRDTLRQAGWEARLYAEHIATGLAGQVLPASHFCRDLGFEDVLIYHHSIHWEPGDSLYTRANCRRIIKYHNITPPEFFADYSHVLQESCAEGRQQTGRLVSQGADLYLGDSAFNLQDLLQAGADRSRTHVLHPFHQAEMLEKSQADLTLLARLLDGAINILFVGRFVPNKGHLHLLRTFARFREEVHPNSRLVLVGKPHPLLTGYSAEMEANIKELRLERAVALIPGASLEELRAIYLSAHLFLCMSEHEGFCVPLVEAMRHKVPIVALARTAVVETLGPGTLTSDSPDPALLAEMMEQCLEHRSARQFTDRGYERYQRMFSPAMLSRQFLQLIAGVVG
jgi:glycosyltransferase involved in cell wall biosynthesis